MDGDYWAGPVWSSRKFVKQLSSANFCYPDSENVGLGTVALKTPHLSTTTTRDRDYTLTRSKIIEANFPLRKTLPFGYPLLQPIDNKKIRKTNYEDIDSSVGCILHRSDTQIQFTSLHNKSEGFDSSSNTIQSDFITTDAAVSGVIPGMWSDHNVSIMANQWIPDVVGKRCQGISLPKHFQTQEDTVEFAHEQDVWFSPQVTQRLTSPWTGVATYTSQQHVPSAMSFLSLSANGDIFSQDFHLAQGACNPLVVNSPLISIQQGKSILSKWEEEVIKMEMSNLSKKDNLYYDASPFFQQINCKDTPSKTVPISRASRSKSNCNKKNTINDFSENENVKIWDVRKQVQEEIKKTKKRKSKSAENPRRVIFWIDSLLDNYKITDDPPEPPNASHTIPQDPLSQYMPSELVSSVQPKKLKEYNDRLATQILSLWQENMSVSKDDLLNDSYTSSVTYQTFPFNTKNFSFLPSKLQGEDAHQNADTHTQHTDTNTHQNTDSHTHQNADSHIKHAVTNTHAAHSLTNTHAAHSVTNTHAHSLTNTHAHSVTNTHATHSLTNTHAHSITNNTHAHSLTNTHAHTVTNTHSAHSLTNTHAHSLTNNTHAAHSVTNTHNDHKTYPSTSSQYQIPDLNFNDLFQSPFGPSQESRISQKPSRIKTSRTSSLINTRSSQMSSQASQVSSVSSKKLKLSAKRLKKKRMDGF
ncbi:hypothetical protein Pcinc_030855 [Petrolisthes cinctipes]|uniref:Uncharacterized protein n=1 Tax=Petrolisthes cinctipes TaxID=88211 RepID=A0AAE1EXH9_PETCI|nr:hypothetical protein Pcinc_030855 [Petrolisthes cinctipes]